MIAVYMKRVFVFCILILSLTHVFSQTQTDSVKFENSVGTVFMQNNAYLSPRQMLYVTQMNEEANYEMQIAQNCRVSGRVLMIGGVVAVGWTLGSVILGGEPGWLLAGIGAGCIITSVGLHSVYVLHARRSVTIFNEGLKQKGLRNPVVNLGLSGSGIGICLRFL
jgi:hypothetical protein